MNKLVITGLGALVITAIVVLVALGIARRPVEESVAPAATQDNQSTSPSTDTDTSAGANSTTAPEQLTATVNMTGSQFQPATLTIKKGTTVTWFNQESVQHNVVSSDGKLPGLKSELLGRGGSYSFIFDTVGSFAYLCEPHRSFMQGTVVVTD